jgi:serine/threonine protein kinase
MVSISPDASDMPAIVGPYYLGALVNDSQTATIYEAYDPERCAKLALKVRRKLHHDLYVDECDILRSVAVPVVINLIDTIELDQYDCIVLPLAGTGDLLQYLRTAPGNRLPEELCCKIVYYVADALSHLHGSGIWHRDVKPENILIMNDTGKPLTDPQIVLSGLSCARTFALDEFCDDPLEPSAFAAPEVLNREECMFYFLIHRRLYN